MDDRLMEVLIIEDHPAMACGTQWILEQVEGVKVTGIATSGEDGIRMAMETVPFAVFLDLQLPDMNGKEVAARLREWSQNIRIILFTGHDYVPLFNAFMDIGINGFLSKNATPRQVSRLLEAVLDGETVLPMELFHKLRLGGGEARQIKLPLTDQEQKIMKLVSRGQTNAQIAKEIFMSTRSVENYLSKIYEKLHVKTRAEAVEKFIRGT